MGTQPESKTSPTYLVILLFYTFTILFFLVVLLIQGYQYYLLPLEERFYHDAHQSLKPGGVWGHGLGIIGSFLMLIGVTTYMIRKRFRAFHRYGRLKYWLEFHIFLCILGPILVLFHTSFKFGGIVAVSFWSMVAVFLSGIIGRFIYIKLARTSDGRELTTSEIEGLPEPEKKKDRLLMLKKMFQYWHVAHLPFAFVMLIIMIIHVVVTMILGYRWIF